AGYRSGVHAIRTTGGRQMITLAPRKFDLFQAAGRHLLYLVPGAAIFALDDITSAVLAAVTETKRTEAAVVDALAERFDGATVHEAVADLLSVRAIGYEHERESRTPRVLPLMPASLSTGRSGVIPLTSLVMNLTNQCTMACTDSFEYGVDTPVDQGH